MGQDLGTVQPGWFPQIRAMGVQVGFRSRNDNNAVSRSGLAVLLVQLLPSRSGDDIRLDLSRFMTPDGWCLVRWTAAPALTSAASQIVR
jgi:hypothetical protein